MIQISLQQIQDCNPSPYSWQKLLASKGKTTADDEMFPLVDVLDSNGLEDALWCLRCLPEHNNLWRKFVWWCAFQVADQSDDQRVQECLDVVWRHSNGEASDDDLAAAREAALEAAWEAAGEAWEAAWAAARAAGVEAWAVAGADQANKLREILTAGEWRHD